METDSPYEQTKKDLSKINVATIPSKTTEPVKEWCDVCPSSRLILQENDTVYFCPSCGTKTLVKDIVHTSSIRAKYGPISKFVAISQGRQAPSRGFESVDDIPGYIDEETVEDLRKMGIKVSRVVQY